MSKILESKSSNKYPKWFYAIGAIIPILFVLLLELILSITNYGTDYTTFVKISDQFENYKFFNPKLPLKYFGKSTVKPSVIPDGFLRIKGKNTFRICALGGSTTAGFPHPPNGSFPRLLKNILEDQYPNTEFEVVNLGISAINSITIRDIINDVLEEKPDLILIYAGHNEYYGALGAASNVSYFGSQALTRLGLELKNFRTFQLMENIIADVINFFNDEDKSGKTLMREMAGKDLVPFNSDAYNSGIDQFESNLKYILNKCADENVPVITGTLVANLLQTPLCKYSGCDSLVAEFNEITSDINEDAKDELYLIKDRDELRFRAPEKFNEIINNLAKSHNSKVVDIQKSFEKMSQFNIIGNNLMMDHLHPTHHGNQIIAKIFSEEISRSKIINSNFDPSSGKLKIRNETISLISYSILDSIFADFNIKYLMNDFPFNNPDNKISQLDIKLQNIEDSLAYDCINRKISWESAHIKLAENYLKNNRYFDYANEINILIDDKPFDKYPYFSAIKSLEKLNQTELVMYFLKKYYNYFNDVSTLKRIGDLYYKQKKNDDALNIYQKYLAISKYDAETYFNLSAIYFTEKNLPKAFENIKRCLEIDPKYPNAQRIYNGLVKMYANKPNQ